MWFSQLLERLRFTFTPNGRREFVPRGQISPLFSVHCFYTKISSSMPVLTTGIVEDCFYLLIFYSEKFSSWVWRLPFAVNLNLYGVQGRKICLVSCAIKKRGFLRLHLCRHTFASLLGPCLCLPHFDALTHVVILVSSAFIFQTFAEVCYSVFVKRSSFERLPNLRKAYIFQEFAEGLLSICVCWIFQSVHRSNVSATVVSQSKLTELWSSAAPFHHDMWYFRHRTNEHFRSMLFIRKNI